MKPCFIKLTISKFHGEPDQAIYKNMNAISAIEEGPQGGSILVSECENAWAVVAESPAQIMALIQEASK